MLILGHALIILGAFLIVTTTVGFIRFNNIYTQIHIATLSDMVGFPAVLSGIALLCANQKLYHITLKLILAIVLWYIVIPITSYTLIKMTYFYNQSNRNKSIT
jgi:multicomponent Na+:H+ antiporter subunit G